MNLYGLQEILHTWTSLRIPYPVSYTASKTTCFESLNHTGTYIWLRDLFIVNRINPDMPSSWPSSTILFLDRQRLMECVQKKTKKNRWEPNRMYKQKYFITLITTKKTTGVKQVLFVVRSFDPLAQWLFWISSPRGDGLIFGWASAIGYQFSAFAGHLGVCSRSGSFLTSHVQVFRNRNSNLFGGDWSFLWKWYVTPKPTALEKSLTPVVLPKLQD